MIFYNDTVYNMWDMMFADIISVQYIKVIHSLSWVAK